MSKLKSVVFLISAILILSWISALSFVDDKGTEKNESKEISSKQKYSSVAFSKDNQTFAIGDEKGEVFLIQLNSLNFKILKPFRTKITEIHFLKNSNSILISTHFEIVHIDYFGKVLAKFKIELYEIDSIQISKDESHVLISDGSKLILFHVNGVKIKEFHPENRESVFGIFSFSNEEKILFLNRTKIVEFDLFGKNLQKWNLDFINEDIKFVDSDYDSKNIIIATHKNIYVIDESKKIKNKFHYTANFDLDRKFNVSTISPDGNFIITSTEKEVVIWSTNGNKINNFVGHNSIVSGFNFTSDSKFFATASTDSTVRIWDINSKESLVFFFENKKAIFYKDNGDYVFLKNLDFNSSNPDSMKLTLKNLDIHLVKNFLKKSIQN